MDPSHLHALQRDAAQRLGSHEQDLEMVQFTQSFSSTSCGFPGMAGQAFTDGLVTVACAPDGAACVYVGGRLAYRVGRANARLREDADRHQLIEAARYEGEYDELPIKPRPEFEVRGSKRGVRRGPHALSRAIDEAWSLARYGSRHGAAPKTAEVLVAGTDQVVARAVPAGEGEHPEIERTELFEQYSDAARFPRVVST